MLYVLSHFWGWIFLAALGLGLIAGVLTWSRAQPGDWFSGWMTWSFIAFIIGVLAVAFRLLEGRWNLYLETALAMFAAYVVGCLLGSWLHALFAAPAPSFAVQGATAAVTASAVSFTYPPAPANAPLEIDSSAVYPGRRPPGLAAAEGAVDDLTRIMSIGLVEQKMLNDLGIFHFRQIALWTPEHVLWIDHHMAHPGRVNREGWSRQAASMMSVAGAAVPSTSVSVAAAARPVAADVSIPAAAPRLPDEDKHPGQRPPSFAQPRGGKADDLKRIRGIGRQNEERLNGLGVWHFDQIAGWTKANVDWAGSYMAFPGRIEREEWVSQARQLAQGGETDFSKRVEAGLVPSSSDGPSRKN